MAAGLGFKTFTTGEVLTAADVNGYLMQGVLVFANAAARTTAITSPQEGQYSFLKDTNALEYYDGAAWVGAPVGDITGITTGTDSVSGGGTSGTVTITNDMATTITASGDIVVGTGSGTYDNLPIGTTGQVLTADTTVSPYKVKWASAGSSGALTLITPTSTSNSGGSVSTSGGAVTATGVTSVSLNGVFSSTYDNYLVLMNSGKLASGAAELQMRMRASGTDATTAYYYAGNYALFTGSTGVNNLDNGSYFNFSYVSDLYNTGAYSFVYSPNIAEATTFASLQNRYDAAQYTTGQLRNTTQYDGITIYPATGSFSGVIRVYGLAN